MLYNAIFTYLHKKTKLERATYMDYKRSKAPTNTVTHNLMDFCQGTDNVYESIAIMAKRSNQIAVKMKEDLNKKLKEFSSGNDGLEETFENLEQIEISRYYEKLPKPTLMAADEFLNKRIYYRNPAKDKENLDD